MQLFGFLGTVERMGSVHGPLRLLALPVFRHLKFQYVNGGALAFVLSVAVVLVQLWGALPVQVSRTSAARTERSRHRVGWKLNQLNTYVFSRKSVIPK